MYTFWRYSHGTLYGPESKKIASRQKIGAQGSVSGIELKRDHA
tara:strand:- start:8866 stop:8994 length:129 start_codon:yes stop_codon:yes gene_type:complete